MAPCLRTRPSRPKTARTTRRTNFKKPVVIKPKPKSKPKNQKRSPPPSPPPSSPSKSSSVISGGLPNTITLDSEGVDVSSPCSTPKAQRFRIPEIVSCPPAPKKARVSSTCLLQRSPIAFFAPPDLELFFYYANRGISV